LCGSSSSISIPSLKFVALDVRKIWCTMCVSINGPGMTLIFDLNLETGVRVASKVGNLPAKFGPPRPFGSRIIRYVCDGRTDEQKQRLFPLTYGRVAGHNNKYLKTCKYPQQILLAACVCLLHTALQIFCCLIERYTVFIPQVTARHWALRKFAAVRMDNLRIFLT